MKDKKEHDDSMIQLINFEIEVLFYSDDEGGLF